MILTILSFMVVMVFVYWTGENMKQSGFESRETQQRIESQLVISSFEKELDKFAMMVLGIRKQIQAIDHTPDPNELQSFLHAQLEGMNFQDSLVISFLDTNHIFQYSVTSTTIYANELAGESVTNIRDSVEVNRLNKLMNTDDLLLFPPLDLIEGWIGIPLCFRLQKKGETLGYFAPIIDFESMIDEVYQQSTFKNFVYKFSYNNEFLFDRNAIYDGNDLSDPAFYQDKNNLSDSDFLENSFSSSGIRFYIGVAHKEAFQLSYNQRLLLSSWYFIIIIIFSGIWFFSYWQKKKKLELKKNSDQLINYNQALERFTFAVSHDLKEPLRTIGSFSSLLQRRYKDTIDETGQEYFGFIQRNVTRMYILLESLLQYATLVNTDEVPKEKIALYDVIKEVEESLLASLREDNTQLIIDDNFPKVYANSMQIHQLIQNLVSNAIKFNDKESRQVHIGFKNRNGQHIFFVKDNGIGIDKEYQDKIFGTFQQLDKQNYKGAGVGLAICKRIVDQHDGEIWLESEKGKGSTFYFSLPAEL